MALAGGENKLTAEELDATWPGEVAAKAGLDRGTVLQQMPSLAELSAGWKTWCPDPSRVAPGPRQPARRFASHPSRFALAGVCLQRGEARSTRPGQGTAEILTCRHRAACCRLAVVPAL